MFGFGNSKQKKYKKALEEFLQKMMSVKDYFEIIQARGKGHAQMAEMLGVKVSDTDYWAKEHFEEYKSRLSESNDPLAEIELRLKNYSFIKKEMEVFINYAKELEMNLTQGFVDDYYATVATCKSLKMCETFFDVNSFDKYIDNQFIENDEKVTFSIICKYLHKREDRFEEIITVELIKNDDVIKQYVFRHNTLEKLDVNDIDKSSYSSEIFFNESEVENKCTYKEEVYERYDYIVESLTMIKRMKKYPTNFNNMFVKLRGLGVYSFNREINIEVDKFKFLSWCSTYGIHLYDHSYKEIRHTQRNDADEETSLEFLKGLSQVYPFTYFIIDRHGLQPILDFSVNPENLVMVCRYHDSKLGLSWIFESFGPDHKMIDSTYKCGPEEEKTDKNQTEEDTEDLTYELNFDEFKGCDFYLKNEYEESVKFPDFHKIINGGITNSERYLKFTSKEGIFDSDELEREILRGVQMSFDRFINENPQVEKESSDETLELWFKFIKYCYCNEPETYELNEIFTFEPSELMIKAYEQTITWFREYYVDHENVASRLVEDENPSEVVVDKLEKISSEINTGDFFNLLKFPEGNWTKEDESVNIKEKESYDLRKLIVELSDRDFDKTTYHDNGEVQLEFNEIDGVFHGEYNSYFKNGNPFKKQKYKNGNLIFLEEYHLNGTLVRKGELENSQEVGEWEYYDAKTGKKVSKEYYERNWFQNLPEEFKYFETKDEDEENGVDKFWQICEYNVIAYKNDKVVAEGYIEFEIYENTWMEEVCEYDREGEGSVFIINGKEVDYNEFDNVELDTEREMVRYSDLSYAQDSFKMLIRGMTSK